MLLDTCIRAQAKTRMLFDQTYYIHNGTMHFITGSLIKYNHVKQLVFASKGYPFKNIFDFTTAGDWDCVAAVERLPALHYSVDFIFMSFGIMVFTGEL